MSDERPEDVALDTPDWRDDPRPTEDLIDVALSTEDDDEYWHIVATLHTRGTRDIYDAMAGLASSELPIARQLCADVLGQFGYDAQMPYKEESVTLLLDRLSQEDPDVLDSVIVALGHLGDGRAAVPVAQFKNHPVQDIRFAVAWSLPALAGDDETAIRAIIELTGDVDEEVRDWATFGLGFVVDVDTPEIREALLKRLDEVNGEIRCEALLGLARRKDERVLDPLIRELELIPDAHELWYDSIESAEELADPRLLPALELIAGMPGLGLDLPMVTRAIAACRGEVTTEDAHNSHAHNHAELVQIAQEVAEKTAGILCGQIEPNDPELHRWAATRFVRIGKIECANENLAKSAEDCLVDILSCDNATWDTAMPVFQGSLAKLNQWLAADS